jgi:hypothetical protein
MMSENGTEREQQQAAAENHQAWEDLCLDPHAAALEEGRQLGRRDALQSGFNDGYQLGRTTAIEYGMELGYIRGVVSVIQEEGLAETTDERTRRSLVALVKAIDEFPGPDEIFRKVSKPVETTEEEELQRDDDDSEQPADRSNLDVAAKMQRIRARFKLLTTRLDIRDVSLKHIMDEAAASYGSTRTPAQKQQEGTEDW